MREIDLRLAVASFPQPSDMGRQGLSNRLVIVENAYLFTDELRDPDRAGVCLGTRPANIPISPVAHQRLGRDVRNPPVLDRKSVVKGKRVPVRVDPGGGR